MFEINFGFLKYGYVKAFANSKMKNLKNKNKDYWENIEESEQISGLF